jgi:hypothetical protein
MKKALGSLWPAPMAAHAVAQGFGAAHKQSAKPQLPEIMRGGPHDREKILKLKMAIGIGMGALLTIAVRQWRRNKRSSDPFSFTWDTRGRLGICIMARGTPEPDVT